MQAPTYSLRPTGAAERLPLPRAMLRRLLRAGRLRVGSRVMLFGEQAGELADCFAWLGISTVDERQTEVSSWEFAYCDSLIWCPDGTNLEGEVCRLADVARQGGSFEMILIALRGPHDTIARLVDELDRRLDVPSQPIIHHAFPPWSPKKLFGAMGYRRMTHAIIACPLREGGERPARRAA